MSVEYDPALHSHAALMEQLTTIQDAHPDARVIGSVGRSVVYGTLLGDTSYEFDFRGQEPMCSAGLARDIDILGVGPSSLPMDGPFTVEITSSGYFSVERDGTDWFVVAKIHGFAEMIRPEVIEPFTGRAIFGIPVTTLPPQTNLEIFGMRGLREKDITTRSLLAGVLDSSESHSRFPDEFLQPFRVLADINKKSAYIRAQDAYRRHIPHSVQTLASPYIRKAKKIVSKIAYAP